MKLLSHNEETIKRIKKYIMYFVVFFGFSFFFSDISFAAGEAKSIEGTVVSVINAILEIAAALLAVLTFLVGLFMHPDWTSGSFLGIGGSDGTLHTLWQTVAGMVYMIFAFVFITIALMNIIGKDGDLYQLKSALPRFIIGVLFIPFSWGFVRTILSLTAILTNAILSMPYDTFEDTEYMRGAEDITICQHFIIDFRSDTPTGPIVCKDDTQVKSLKEVLQPGVGTEDQSLYGITAFYTYGIMRVQSVGKLEFDNIAEGIKSVVDIATKGAFDALFVLVYTILMIALGIVLMIRGIYFWFYAILSPVFGLLFFFKKTGGDSKFSIKEFIALALVPVYVSGILAFGLVFILISGSELRNDGTGSTAVEKFIKDNGQRVKFAGFEITFTGSTLFDAVRSDDETGGNIVKGLQGGFGRLIMQVFTLVVLWIAMMIALNQSKITKEIVAPFESFGKSIGGLMAKAPLYTPIPFTGGQSIQSALNIGEQATQAIQTQLSTQGQDFGRGLGRSLFGTETEILKTLRNMETQAKQAKGNDTAQGSLLKDMLGTLDDSVIQRGSRELKQVVTNLELAGVQMTPDMKRKILDSVGKAQLGRNISEMIGGITNLNLKQRLLDEIGDNENKVIARIGTDVPQADPKSNTPSSVILPRTIVQDIEDKAQYTVGETVIKVENDGTNLATKEITALATALQSEARSNIDDILELMGITHGDTIIAVQKKYDEIKTTTPPPTPPSEGGTSS